MTLLYDGSFEGFLTLVYTVYYEKVTPTEIIKERPLETLFDTFNVIETDTHKAMKVLEALQAKWTKQNLQMVYNIFLCDTRDFELDLLNYIKLGFKSQKQLQNLNHDFVFNLTKLQKELFRFQHKMIAYARFEELEDKTLYAKIDGKFNVIHHLGRHFAKRFNTERFIIHDIKRSLAFLHTEQGKSIQRVYDYEEPTLSASEVKFQRLWKTFFKHVSIESRENLKLQQNHVPLLYRALMTEFHPSSPLES